jgi:hypothetical protein
LQTKCDTIVKYSERRRTGELFELLDENIVRLYEIIFIVTYFLALRQQQVYKNRSIIKDDLKGNVKKYFWKETKQNEPNCSFLNLL